MSVKAADAGENCALLNSSDSNVQKRNRHCESRQGADTVHAAPDLTRAAAGGWLAHQVEFDGHFAARLSDAGRVEAQVG